LDIPRGGLRWFESFDSNPGNRPIHSGFLESGTNRSLGRSGLDGCGRTFGGLKFWPFDGARQIRATNRPLLSQAAPEKMELAVWTPWLLSCPGPGHSRQLHMVPPKRETRFTRDRDTRIPPLTAEPATGRVLVPRQRQLAVCGRMIVASMHRARLRPASLR